MQKKIEIAHATVRLFPSTHRKLRLLAVRRKISLAELVEELYQHKFTFVKEKQEV